MTRTLLSGLAAVAVLAVLADTPANAQQFRQQSGAQPGYAGGNATMGNAGTRSRPQRSRRLRSNQQQPSAVDASTLLALSILRRKCLDNMLPTTPC